MRPESELNSFLYVRVGFVEIVRDRPSKGAGQVVPFVPVYVWVGQHYQRPVAGQLDGLHVHLNVTQHGVFLHQRRPHRDSVRLAWANPLP